MSLLRNTIFAAGFIVMGAVAATGTQAIARSHGMMGPRMMQGLLAGMDLTDAQQELVDAIRDEGRSQMQAQRSERQARKAEMIAMLGSEQIDREAVHSRIDDKLDEMTSFAHSMADQLLDLHATLDADQRAVLVENATALSEREPRHRGGARDGGELDDDGLE